MPQRLVNQIYLLNYSPIDKWFEPENYPKDWIIIFTDSDDDVLVRLVFPERAQS